MIKSKEVNIFKVSFRKVSFEILGTKFISKISTT